MCHTTLAGHPTPVLDGTHACTEQVAMVLPAASSAGDQQLVGFLGEAAAAAHLDRHGLEQLARNWRAGGTELRGELDVVAYDQARRRLVVVEVKVRRDAAHFGGALGALQRPQRRRSRALAARFASTCPRRLAEVRFDLIAVDLQAARGEPHALEGPLTHIEDAW